MLAGLAMNILKSKFWDVDLLLLLERFLAMFFRDLGTLIASVEVLAADILDTTIVSTCFTGRLLVAFLDRDSLRYL